MKKNFFVEAVNRPYNRAAALLKEESNRLAITRVALIATGLMLSSHSMAGTGGQEFDDVWMTLTDWMQGTLGRVVSGAMVLVGIVGGVIRQNVMAFATGVGGGIGLYNTPKVIEAIMSATITMN